MFHQDKSKRGIFLLSQLMWICLETEVIRPLSDQYRSNSFKQPIHWVFFTSQRTFKESYWHHTFAIFFWYLWLGVRSITHFLLGQFATACIWGQYACAWFSYCGKCDYIRHRNFIYKNLDMVTVWLREQFSLVAY